MKERWHFKKSLPPDKHLPNKRESRLLRRLMSETGLTEQQIRDHYKYRVMLSNAARNPVGSPTEQYKRKLKQWVRYYAVVLNLPHYHPDVKQKAINALTKPYYLW